ncbi:MAG: sulfur carrier protein ThiS [Bacteroidia bacterium]|nr:sulfur carrier protein ThiS [Bacteroidia bacterium]MDW8158072.1 sulfur carrier protein ThiS [Bacteroidia bacterium]
MKIIVNGELIVFAQSALKIIELLQAKKISLEGIAVAVNDNVIKKSEWDKFELQEGDKVEIVYARQGG